MTTTLLIIAVPVAIWAVIVLVMVRKAKVRNQAMQQAGRAEHNAILLKAWLKKKKMGRAKLAKKAGVAEFKMNWFLDGNPSVLNGNELERLEAVTGLEFSMGDEPVKAE
jgi:predicted aspartyl protease